MPLRDAMEMIAAEVVSAGARGVPLVGMKLDYDLTILDTQSRTLCGRGLPERGWCGPVLDAVVLDRHEDRFRKGSRTLSALCAHYGVCIENAHDAVADAVASAEVLFALAARFASLGEAEPIELHQAQIAWHREWAESYDDWRVGRGMTPMDRRDFIWPVASAVVSDPVMRLSA
jgi:DNA polymerase-3 subunit epsilon